MYWAYQLYLFRLKKLQILECCHLFEVVLKENGNLSAYASTSIHHTKDSVASKFLCFTAYFVILWWHRQTLWTPKECFCCITEKSFSTCWKAVYISTCNCYNWINNIYPYLQYSACRGIPGNSTKHMKMYKETNIYLFSL